MENKKGIFLKFFTIFFIAIVAIAYFAEQKIDQTVHLTFILPFALVLSIIGAAIAAVAIPGVREIEAYEPPLNYPEKPIEEIQSGLKRIRILRMLSHGPILLLLIIAVPLFLGPEQLHDKLLPIWEGAFYLMIGGFFLGAFLRGLNCPRCGNRYHLKMTLGNKSRLYNEFTKKCVYCGLRLDGKEISGGGGRC